VSRSRTIPGGLSALKAARQQAAYLAIRAGIGAISVWPPEVVLDAAGSLGRTYASMNKRRLTRAMQNLAVAFPGWDEARRREAAIGAHEHLFKFGVEFAYAPRLLSEDSWPDHLELGDLGAAIRGLISGRPCILITGHCGNWELLAYALALMGFPMHALYRPLDLPPMDRWLTIGSIDKKDWLPLFGASWQQRGGRILVGGVGSGFGGRSLCLAQSEPPELPYEVAVSVKLDDEAGAAGLVPPGAVGDFGGTEGRIGVAADAPP